MKITTSKTTPAGTQVILERDDDEDEPRIYLFEPEQDEEREKVGFVHDGDCAVFVDDLAGIGPNILRAIADLIEEAA